MQYRFLHPTYSRYSSTGKMQFSTLYLAGVRHMTTSMYQIDIHVTVLLNVLKILQVNFLFVEFLVSNLHKLMDMSESFIYVTHSQLDM